MMGIRRPSAANQARLPGNRLDVIAVTNAAPSDPAEAPVTQGLPASLRRLLLRPSHRPLSDRSLRLGSAAPRLWPHWLNRYRRFRQNVDRVMSPITWRRASFWGNSNLPQAKAGGKAWAA